jgi:uncharacterized membrane protein YoaT (DUF817 family)
MNDWRLEFVIEAFLIIFGITAISLLWRDNLSLTLLLLVSGIVMMGFMYEKGDFTFFIVGAVIGTAGELIAIQYGAWLYSNPSFLSVPVWLPLAWGYVVVLIKKIAGTLSRAFEIKL